jgi:hypothetical protein
VAQGRGAYMELRTSGICRGQMYVQNMQGDPEPSGPQRCVILPWLEQSDWEDLARVQMLFLTPHLSVYDEGDHAW